MKATILMVLLAATTAASALPTNPWVIERGKGKDVSAALPTMPFVWPRWVRDLFTL